MRGSRGLSLAPEVVMSERLPALLASDSGQSRPRFSDQALVLSVLRTLRTHHRPSGAASGLSLFVRPTSKLEFELRGCTRRLDRRWFRIELELRQDLNDHMPLRDHCDQTPQRMAHPAAQNLHIENPAHERRPQVTVRRTPGTAGPLFPLRVGRSWVAVRDGGRGGGARRCARFHVLHPRLRPAAPDLGHGA